MYSFNGPEDNDYFFDLESFVNDGETIGCYYDEDDNDSYNTNDDD